MEKFFRGPVYRTLIYALLGIVAIITLTPYLWLFCSAFKSTADFFAYLFLPLQEEGEDGFLGIAWGRLTLSNFTGIFTELGVLRNLLNSVFLASTVSLLATLFSAMCGYSLAKFKFKGRRFCTNLVLAALIIPAPLLLASSYQVLYRLNLLDTYAGLILPALAPAFGVFLFRQAMLNTIPISLIECARIEGAGELRIFFTIALPLVRPMLGAFLMITFLQTWNNFIQPQIVLQNPEYFPLSVAIANLQNLYTTNYGYITAGTVTSILPVLLLFLLLQKEYISGLTSGAEKT